MWAADNLWAVVPLGLGLRQLSCHPLHLYPWHFILSGLLLICCGSLKGGLNSSLSVVRVVYRSSACKKWIRRENLSLPINWHVLKQSTRLPFKPVHCCENLHDQKEEEPGRCRIWIQLNILCKDYGRLDMRIPSSPLLATITTMIPSMSWICSKRIAEDLWRLCAGLPTSVQYLIFFPFFLHFPCLGV